MYPLLYTPHANSHRSGLVFVRKGYFWVIHKTEAEHKNSTKAEFVGVNDALP